MISLIVAHDEALAIGYQGWMPWNLPEDLKHFKAVTSNHAILMGRTTFEAMKRPLPNRHTYVATNQRTYQYDHEDVTIIHDLEALLKEWKSKEDTLFICGGAKIYKECLNYADELWISLVDGVHPADTYFPQYDPSTYTIISKEQKSGFLIIHYRKK